MVMGSLSLSFSLSLSLSLSSFSITTSHRLSMFSLASIHGARVWNDVEFRLAGDFFVSQNIAKSLKSSEHIRANEEQVHLLLASSMLESFNRVSRHCLSPVAITETITMRGYQSRKCEIQSVDL